MLMMNLVKDVQLESSYERFRPSSTAVVLPTISEELEVLEKTGQTSPISTKTVNSKESIEMEARRLSITAIHSAFSAAVMVSEGGCRARVKQLARCKKITLGVAFGLPLQEICLSFLSAI
ncbi:uncharacterized protein LOC133181174 [Saccostrea echinata]|uniref:uncharacterized protein LOC133181174 n=1 Tax=Saccostrea echinata TaxID=191078 RepID=UPI002A800F1A|nr:uncharacterized protein LOC133181174 [Saccostrea echinata]